jgi:hypothetical protein
MAERDWDGKAGKAGRRAGGQAGRRVQLLIQAMCTRGVQAQAWVQARVVQEQTCGYKVQSCPSSCSTLRTYSAHKVCSLPTQYGHHTSEGRRILQVGELSFCRVGPAYRIEGSCCNVPPRLFEVTEHLVSKCSVRQLTRSVVCAQDPAAPSSSLAPWIADLKTCSTRSCCTFTVS